MLSYRAKSAKPLVKSIVTRGLASRITSKEVQEDNLGEVSPSNKLSRAGVKKYFDSLKNCKILIPTKNHRQYSKPLGKRFLIDFPRLKALIHSIFSKKEQGELQMQIDSFFRNIEAAPTKDEVREAQLELERCGEIDCDAPELDPVEKLALEMLHLYENLVQFRLVMTGGDRYFTLYRRGADPRSCRSWVHFLKSARYAIDNPGWDWDFHYRAQFDHLRPKHCFSSWNLAYPPIFIFSSPFAFFRAEKSLLTTDGDKKKLQGMTLWDFAYNAAYKTGVAVASKVCNQLNNGLIREPEIKSLKLITRDVSHLCSFAFIFSRELKRGYEKNPDKPDPKLWEFWISFVTKNPMFKHSLAKIIRSGFLSAKERFWYHEGSNHPEFDRVFESYCELLFSQEDTPQKLRSVFEARENKRTLPKKVKNFAQKTKLGAVSDPTIRIFNPLNILAKFGEQDA